MRTILKVKLKNSNEWKYYLGGKQQKDEMEREFWDTKKLILCEELNISNQMYEKGYPRVFTKFDANKYCEKVPYKVEIEDIFVIDLLKVDI